MTKTKFFWLSISGWLVVGVFMAGSFFKERLFRATPVYAGSVAENFAVLDSKGEYFELHRHANAKLLVFITHGVECPIVQKQFPVLKAIAKNFSNKGVEFFLVNSSPQDSLEKIRQEVEEYGIDLPVLIDHSQIVSDGLHLTRTAEAVVIETEGWNIVYQGSIDDRLTYDSDKLVAKNNYLEDAIQSVLNRESVKITKTKGIGCAISAYTWPKSLTYQDVAPILQAKCLHCHNPNGATPQNLSTYEDAKGWAPMMREVIRTRRMPPWEPDPSIGKFKGDFSLTDHEAGILIKWVDRGASEGEKRDLTKTRRIPRPPVKPFKADITYGPFSIDVPAYTPRPWNYIFLGRAEEDIWISAQQAVLSKPRLIQHLVVLALAVPLDVTTQIFEPENFMKNEDVYARIRFSPYVKVPFFLPTEAAIKIPRGAYLYLEQHLALNGKQENLQTTVKFSRYRGKKKPKEFVYVPLVMGPCRVPPERKDHRVSKSQVLKNDAMITLFAPHMHLRGLSMKVEAIDQDKIKRTLISIPHYLFKNRRAYILDPPVFLKAGTTLTATAVYDNSRANPANPNPKTWVENGPDPNDHEMCIMHLWHF